MARHIVITDTETGKTELDIVAVAGMYAFTPGGVEEREVYASTHWTGGNRDDIASVLHAMKKQIKDFKKKYPQLVMYMNYMVASARYKTEVVSEEEKVGRKVGRNEH